MLNIVISWTRLCMHSPSHSIKVKYIFIHKSIPSCVFRIASAFFDHESFTREKIMEWTLTNLDLNLIKNLWSIGNMKLYESLLIGLVGRVFANGPEDLGSIPGRVIPKILKMVLDTALLNTQRYKVRIKGKVEQSRERSSALSYTLV